MSDDVRTDEFELELKAFNLWMKKLTDAELFRAGLDLYAALEARKTVSNFMMANDLMN